MHWDNAGRSLCSCEITLESFGQAKALMADMDGAEVDGYLVQISLIRFVGGNLVKPDAIRHEIG